MLILQSQVIVFQSFSVSRPKNQQAFQYALYTDALYSDEIFFKILELSSKC